MLSMIRGKEQIYDRKSKRYRRVSMKKWKIGKDAKYKINIVKNSHQKSFKEKIFTEISFTHS